MPVPVPRHTKPCPHPVVKSTKPTLPSNLPPFVGEEWSASARRIHHLPSSEQAGLAHNQDFPQGLTTADNASVIKGPHAEACIPPIHSLPPALRLLLGALAARDQSLLQSDKDQDMVTIDHHPQSDSLKLSGAAALYGGFGDNISPTTGPAYAYEAGAFSPVFEDQSPGSASGPDSGSSPLEPLTPFGDFVDRAVTAAQSYTQYDEHGIPAADYYHDKQIIQEVTHAALVFPSIADVPKQQDPVPQPSSSPPSASSGYKKLSEPLAEWVANYVWRVCTTGYSLPPAFTRHGLNTYQFPGVPPSYLAPGIQTVLLATLLQPSVVFLAMWYIVKLPIYFGAAPLGSEFMKESAFRVALLGEDQPGYEREALEQSAPIRLVVLGFMLANKWLDDHTFSNKTWHSISTIPGPTLNRLESLALTIFNYDLSISNQRWSQWLGHIMSYHTSLTAPGRPQPISRPSTNPHMMVRRVIEEIMQHPCPIVSADGLPTPVFLGLEERQREKAEKEAAMASDVLEIDLDEDGPLREEYLPKRRASKQLSHKSQLMVLPQVPPIKHLPPPAKWSPSGDEPILRERNHSTGHYVAVQAPHLGPAAPVFHLNGQHQDVAFSQNWAPPYLPVKQMGYSYDLPPFVSLNPPAYNHFGQTPALAVPHSRSQSLSYDQDSLGSCNHMRSFSQAGFGYRFNDLRMTMGEQPIAIPEMESGWMEHPTYPYSGPGFVPLPVNLQPAW